MTHYPKEFKESIIVKMVPPQNASVPLLSKETGIPTGTLYSWQHKARGRNSGVTTKSQSTTLNNEERFAIILETASFNEVELGEYCRQKGIYPEHIKSWKDTFIHDSPTVISKSQRQQTQQQSKTIQQLQIELRRKDKALAEAAALLILQKKFQALWTEAEDEK